MTPPDDFIKINDQIVKLIDENIEHDPLELSFIVFSQTIKYLCDSCTDKNKIELVIKNMIDHILTHRTKLNE